MVSNAFDRFALSPEDYLNRHHLLAYMEDCVARMLDTKDDKIDPNTFIMQYFTNVRDGHHVMLREHAFVRLTPHNRLSFIRLVWNCFRQIGSTKDLLSIHDYHSLITLICPDFPIDLLYKTARIILLDDALDCLISFSDFIHAFQLQVYYEEFLDKVSEIYNSLQQGEVIAQDTVIVPSAVDVTAVHVNNVSSAQDGVCVSQFLRLLAPIADSVDFSTVDVATLHDLLRDSRTITYYGFLVMLARSDAINTTLGILPKKSELIKHLSLPCSEEAARQDGGTTVELTHVAPSPESCPKKLFKHRIPHGKRPVSTTDISDALKDTMDKGSPTMAVHSETSLQKPQRVTVTSYQVNVTRGASTSEDNAMSVNKVLPVKQQTAGYGKRSTVDCLKRQSRETSGDVRETSSDSSDSNSLDISSTSSSN